jgi:hypothetical protein
MTGQSNAGLRAQGPVQLPWFVGLFVVMPLLFALGFLTILFLPFVWAFQYLQNRWFVRRMRTQGRFVAWTALEPLLVAGHGCLIVEQVNKKGGARVWHTAENPLMFAPVPPQPEEELNYVNPSRDPHPFVVWCERRYLNATTGTASLTEPPYSYPRGLVESAFFLERFPALQVIMTPKISKAATERSRA